MENLAKAIRPDFTIEFEFKRWQEPEGIPLAEITDYQDSDA